MQWRYFKLVITNIGDIMREKKIDYGIFYNLAFFDIFSDLIDTGFCRGLLQSIQSYQVVSSP